MIKAVEEKKSHNGFFVVLLLVILVCGAYTAYDFVLFSGSDNGLIIPFAVIIFLAFLVVNFLLFKRRLDRNVWSLGILLPYILVFLFTVWVNYVGIVTPKVAGKVYRAELSQHLVQVDEVYNRAIKAIDGVNAGTDEKIDRIHSLTEQLRIQITDPARPGLGERARQLIVEIEGLLGEKLTELGTNAKPEDLADRYEDNIQKIISRVLKSGDYKRGVELKEQLTTEHDDIVNSIKETSAWSDSRLNEEGFAFTSNVVAEINNLVLTTKEFIKDNEKFDYPTVEFEAYDIAGTGIFSKSLAYKSDATQAFLWAIIIDVLPGILGLIYVSFIGGSNKNSNSRNNKETKGRIHYKYEEWPTIN